MPPKRIQRKRVAGTKTPAGTIYCGRPGPYGNPYRIGNRFPEEFSGYEWYGDGTITEENCIEGFRIYAEERLKIDPTWLDPLRGHNLSCWCSIWRCEKNHRFGHEIPYSRTIKYCRRCSRTLMRVPCHVDTLLEFSNRRKNLHEH